MKKTLSLFEGIGLEFEYMIVKEENLNINPIADKLLKDASGKFSDYENGGITWSNELVNHVIEIKNDIPTKDLILLKKQLNENISQVNKILKKYDSCLMPTSAHPWMNPKKESVLWQHEKNEIYEKYNQIFNCQGHGWTNLQSTHINLPFSGDRELRKLHSAVRIILPLIPAICASSPMIERKKTGICDSRLKFYQENQKKVPSIIGKVIPEVVNSKKEYFEKILEPMYKEISKYDPKKILQEEWLNSRGAIIKFSRSSLEIRIADIQECVSSDIAIVWFFVNAIEEIVKEKYKSIEIQETFTEEELYEILLGGINEGGNFIITNKKFLNFFGIEKSCETKELLKKILDDLKYLDTKREFFPIIKYILEKGNLSQRIINSLNGKNPQKTKNIYRKLCDCLGEDKLF